jgi:hypothetical protein
LSLETAVGPEELKDVPVNALVKTFVALLASKIPQPESTPDWSLKEENTFDPSGETERFPTCDGTPIAPVSVNVEVLKTDTVDPVVT